MPQYSIGRSDVAHNHGRNRLHPCTRDAGLRGRQRLGQPAMLLRASAALLAAACFSHVRADVPASARSVRLRHMPGAAGGPCRASALLPALPASQALLPQLRDAWAEAQPLRMGATANALESSYTSALQPLPSSPPCPAPRCWAALRPLGGAGVPPLWLPRGVPPLLHLPAAAPLSHRQPWAQATARPASTTCSRRGTHWALSWRWPTQAGASATQTTWGWRLCCALAASAAAGAYMEAAGAGP